MNKKMNTQELILPYAKREIARIIRDYYPNLPTRVLALATGLTEAQIYSRAQAMGVKKSPEFREQLLKAEAKKLMESGKAHRFVKGQVPPNKGKKMPPEVYEKVKPTMFSAGHKPHNTKHDGHISIRRDKNGRDYAHIRVREGVYKLLHRVIWEEHNGPIPDGYLVVFKNGDTMNCTLENLELITREENMKRNSIINKYPPELVQAIRLNGALKRRIKGLSERW